MLWKSVRTIIGKNSKGTTAIKYVNFDETTYSDRYETVNNFIDFMLKV